MQIETSLSSLVLFSRVYSMYQYTFPAPTPSVGEIIRRFFSSKSMTQKALGSCGPAASVAVESAAGAFSSAGASFGSSSFFSSCARRGERAKANARAEETRSLLYSVKSTMLTRTFLPATLLRDVLLRGPCDECLL